jgi:uncharacterized damage-inducible protein DinB
MTSEQLAARLDYFRLVHGVTRRAIRTFGDDDLTFRPASGMRSPRELVFHIYEQERRLAEAARDAHLTMEAADASNPEGGGAAQCAQLTTIDAAAAFADACHATLDTTFRQLSSEDLARPVESPFGPYPAWRYLAFAYDEHWHHRGQLYLYLRLLGKEPPMLYDYRDA